MRRIPYASILFLFVFFRAIPVGWEGPERRNGESHGFQSYGGFGSGTYVDTTEQRRAYS